MNRGVGCLKHPRIRYIGLQISKRNNAKIVNKKLKTTNEKERCDKKAKCEEKKLKEYRWKKKEEKTFDKRGRNFGLWMLSPNIPKLSMSISNYQTPIL